MDEYDIGMILKSIECVVKNRKLNLTPLSVVVAVENNMNGWQGLLSKIESHFEFSYINKHSWISELKETCLQCNVEWLEKNKTGYLYMLWGSMYNKNPVFAETCCEVTASMIRQKLKIPDIFWKTTSEPTRRIYQAVFDDGDHFATVIDNLVIDTHFKEGRSFTIREKADVDFSGAIFYEPTLS